MSSLTDDLTQQIGGVLQGNLNTYVTGVKGDLKNFLQVNQAKIAVWTAQLQAGQIQQSDLQDNLLNLEDEFKITTLTEAGVSAIQIENVVNQIIGIIVNKLVSVAVNAVIAAL